MLNLDLPPDFGQRLASRLREARLTIALRVTPEKVRGH
jgi:hypothetical protein